MGVYIPNMSKPKSCEECRFRTCFIKVNLKKYTCWLNGEECGKTGCPLIEIVECKDCKYWTDDMSGNMWCEHAIGGLTEANDFCSYGERANADQHTQCVESVEEEWIDWREDQEYEDRWNTMERRTDE